MKLILHVLAFGIAATLYAAMPAGDTITNSIGMKFKRIPAGTFEIGFEGNTLDSTFGRSANGSYDETPRHKVTFSSDFYMGVYEVMNGEFKHYIPNWPNHEITAWYTAGDSLPVRRINWNQADSFCAWLTANDPNGYQYRLPTEAEWEYCCRAGTTTWFYTGNDITTTDANVALTWGAGVTVKKVGSYAANPWGLYDMLGNATEWCLDWYGPYTADSLVDPAGYTAGDFRVIRGLWHYKFWVRSAARGGSPQELYGAQTNVRGFRVVISDAALNYQTPQANPTPYQRDVLQGKPTPGTIVSGETYTSPEGMVFKRVRMGRELYPSQHDSVVYVSDSPVSGDSSSSRPLARALALRLSTTYQVLHRLANRYELMQAGVSADTGDYYLTLLPDLRYEAGQGHPDIAYLKKMLTATITANTYGPIYSFSQDVANVQEAPNRDLLVSWQSGYGEEDEEVNTAVTRLRWGSSTWDSVSPLMATPGGNDGANNFWNNGRGRLFYYWSTSNGWPYTNALMRYSDDNGATWSQPRIIAQTHPSVADNPVEMGRDTVVAAGEESDVAVSFDGGFTWTYRTIVKLPGMSANYTPDGIHPSSCVLDDGTLLLYKRMLDIKNSDSVFTIAECRTRDFGATMTFTPTCFVPLNQTQRSSMLKLHSGRLLFLVNCNTAPLRCYVLLESEDQGATWFCRRTFKTEVFPGPYYLSKYVSMCQGSDGIIHVAGGALGIPGKLVASFSEQWLKEGSCIDVSQWGINTTGRVGVCPVPDTALHLPDEATESGSVVAAAVTASPNPFNPVTAIRYQLPANTVGLYQIHDIRGKLVRGFKLNQERGSLVWDGCDASGKRLSSGFYTGRLIAGNGLKIDHRMLLLK